MLPRGIYRSVLCQGDGDLSRSQVKSSRNVKERKRAQDGLRCQRMKKGTGSDSKMCFLFMLDKNNDDSAGKLK